MPTITDLYPSNRLSAADLQNKDVLVVVEKVELEEFDDSGRKVTKPVAHFVGSAKTMVLNKTNSLSIADITGQDNTDDWGGARICLYPTLVQFGAKMVEAIRVKRVPEPPVTAPVPAAPTPPAPATPAVAVNPQVDPELNDEIPWSN